MEDTLITRCTVAYEEAAQRIDYPPHTQRVMRAGVAAVIEHLAAELLVMHERNSGRLSAHDAAMLLKEQAGRIVKNCENAPERGQSGPTL